LCEFTHRVEPITKAIAELDPVDYRLEQIAHPASASRLCRKRCASDMIALQP
jgi:hypothetical protein